MSDKVEVRALSDFGDASADTVRRKGETFEVSEDVLENHPNSFERVGDTATLPENDNGAEGDAPFDPSEYTVDELEEELEDGDYSEEELAALAEAERDGEGRDSALDLLA